MQGLIRVCSCGVVGSLSLSCPSSMLRICPEWSWSEEWVSFLDKSARSHCFPFACTARGYARGARAGYGNVAWVLQLACSSLGEKSNKDAICGICWKVKVKVCREKREASGAVSCALDCNMMTYHFPRLPSSAFSALQLDMLFPFLERP